MAQEFIGDSIETVEAAPGRAPRAFVWRGERHEVAEVLDSFHIYGVGTRQRGQTWMPRGRQAYYCLRTAAGRLFELVAEKFAAGEEWVLYRELAEPPTPRSAEEAPHGFVGVGRPKPTLVPPYRIIPFTQLPNAWAQFLLGSCPPQPAGLLPGLTPRAAFAAEYARLIVGMAQLGDAALGGGEGCAEVYALAVLPAFRRVGVGSALLREAAAWAKSAGYRKLQAAAPIDDQERAAASLLQAARWEHERTVMVLDCGGERRLVSPAEYWAQHAHDNERRIVAAFAVYATAL